jgi:hypothetical protein
MEAEVLDHRETHGEDRPANHRTAETCPFTLPDIPAPIMIRPHNPHVAVDEWESIRAEFAMQPRWRSLEAGAHQSEVQEQIRREIRKGTIRVLPGPDGGIRIIPIPDASVNRESLYRESA